MGTHTGKDNLSSRLIEHFITPNKDRSIFRKNIGRALLNQQSDAFLEQWEIDLTKKANHVQFASLIDHEKLKAIELEVTKYMAEHFSFVTIPVSSKHERLALEAGLIATVAQCGECAASPGWLGHYSPKLKIRQSSLWQEQHLSGQCLTELPSSITKS